ncbi:MAG TPA: phosphoglucosamine mutase [Candidatus Hydrogenedentes bacterium]|nr:phosphoglucosamine mutase [Candidatus Hydrogenedentota bacterium]HQH51892.1 phosphoglucosamine mutase [Candidatus Hydrogenedentota bacterium]HQM49386.1 phosphoglucosamine mutase [Candidatus Hydrogenedentota bacterium]
MSERLFGTDGIRGIANRYPMSAELALKVGRAVGHLAQREERPHTILIGKDTRRSGYMLENALTAGLCSMGVHVLLVGPLPTPGVSYILRSLRCDGGIMISASHNAFQYNGIKLFGPDGYKIPDSMEDEITRLIQNGEVEDIRPTAERIGTARRIDDAVGRYIEYAKASFPKGMRLDGLKIVCDCAHGAAYKVGPSTFSELGAEVIAIGERPNGTNINDGCGSTRPEDMRATVIRERADVGIAFDGDADRIVMADEEGRLIDGNGLLAILACDMLKSGRLPQNCLATTIMANGGLLKAIEPLGGKIIWTKVGDRYVVEAMREHDLALGGEASGHMVLLEYNTTGDALIAALQVLATMVRHDTPLSVLASVYHHMPEAHANVPHDDGAVPSEEELAGLVREAEAGLKGRGRVVIRPSGTEPIIRVMVQHEVRREAEALVEALAKRVAAL